MKNNYVIEPHNYERWVKCFTERLAKEVLEKGNEGALAALLELIIE